MRWAVQAKRRDRPCIFGGDHRFQDELHKTYRAEVVSSQGRKRFALARRARRWVLGTSRVYAKSTRQPAPVRRDQPSHCRATCKMMICDSNGPPEGAEHGTSLHNGNYSAAIRQRPGGLEVMACDRPTRRSVKASRAMHEGSKTQASREIQLGNLRQSRPEERLQTGPRALPKYRAGRKAASDVLVSPSSSCQRKGHSAAADVASRSGVNEAERMDVLQRGQLGPCSTDTFALQEAHASSQRSARAVTSKGRSMRSHQSQMKSRKQMRDARQAFASVRRQQCTSSG